VAKVTMPQLGESVAEGTIGKWLKQPGDAVAKNEPLLEVITDKVNAEVPSPFAGTLRQILVQEGQTVASNAEIAEIEEGGGAVAAQPAAPATQAATAPATQAAAPQAPAAPLPAAPLPAAQQPAAPQAPAAPLPAAPLPAAQQPAAPPPAAPQPQPAAQPNPMPARTPAGVPVMEEIESGPDARMTPAVRRMLREHGLTAEQVRGSGHGGRITREDVMAAVEGARNGGAPAAAPQAPQAPAGGAATAAGEAAVSRPQAPAPSPSLPSHAPGLAPSAPSTAPSSSATWEPGQDEVLIPHTQMRRGIAAQMTRAAAIPVAHSTFEADMTGVVTVRAAVGDSYKAREGVGLSFLPFIIKAVVESLHEHPDLNAHYGDDGILRKRRINVGIAIAVDNGLIVPVIHDADQLSINGLNRAIQDLAARARSNKLRLEDLQGGTFTVDNTGWFGSVLTAPILNPPEVCILTTEAVVKRPVVRETPDGDVIAIRSMMNLVAGYDHRATDGAQVGRFVRDVICRLEAIGPDTPIY
jgi:pyruvate/2-oxoglutarate dehydrogenase complex dihydrolipoamide acyltransferase (E2) component